MSDEDCDRLAEAYVATNIRCKDIGKSLKMLREKKSELGDQLLEALDDAGIDAVRLDNGYTVKRVMREKKESVNDEVICSGLSEFLGKHDDAEKPANTRAQEATEFIYENRESEEEWRISVTAPKAAKAKKGAPKKKSAKRQKTTDSAE